MVIEVESQTEDESNGKEDTYNTENEENDPIEEGGEPESHHPSSVPVPYSLIRSSQLMSRSQMMREHDSLMDREIMGPPPAPTDVATDVPAYIIFREMESSCGPPPHDSDDDDL